MTTTSPSRQSLLFLLAGPSGAGKNTLLRSALEQVQQLRQLPSVTTRPRRSGEVDHVHHQFVSEQEFIRFINDDALIEWKIAYDHYYGTLKSVIASALEADGDHIADIDIWGSIKIREMFPVHVVIIFVRTNTLADLERRLLNRGSISQELIAERLDTARRELEEAGKADYLLINDDLELAVAQLCQIISIEREKR